MAPWRGKPIGFLVAPQRLRMRSALPSFNKLGRPGSSPSPDSAARSRSLELRQQTNEPPSAVDWVASGFLFVAKLVLIRWGNRPAFLWIAEILGAALQADGET